MGIRGRRQLRQKQGPQCGRPRAAARTGPVLAPDPSPGGVRGKQSALDDKVKTCSKTIWKDNGERYKECTKNKKKNLPFFLPAVVSGIERAPGKMGYKNDLHRLICACRVTTKKEKRGGWGVVARLSASFSIDERAP